MLESLPFSVSERQSGMFGLLYALESVATLLLMCDGRDMGTAIGERPPAPRNEAGGLSGVPGGDESVADLASSPQDAAEHSAQGPAALLEDDSVPAAHRDEFTPRRVDEVVGANAKEFFEPNLYLFDAYPGGIGFSDPLFRMHDLLCKEARALILACGCDAGCPSCVGPAGDLAPCAKEAALAILERLCA
jgi:DEAD/DEAH box helicase domain-containing protein